MIKAYLWLIKLLSPLWTLLGADSNQLLLIIKTKATMVLRAPVSINPRKKAKDLNLPPWARELLRAFISALFGLIYCPFLFIPNREIAVLYAVFLYLTTISMSTVMTFSTQLVDTADNIVLLPRPIKDRTMVLYRLLFGIYQFLLSAIPMSIPMVVILMIQSGILNGLYFFVLLLPVLILVYAILQMLIMLLLNIFSVRMFGKLIVWLQGIMLILVFIGCQSSFWSKVSALNLDFTLKYTTLLSFMPQYWVASIWLHKAPLWMYAAIWGIPLVSLLFIVIVLAPRYSSKLSQMGNGSEDAKPKKKEKNPSSSYKRKRFFILKHSAAQSAYVFIKQYMSRTKEFKMNVLSSFYYVAITTFPVLLNVWKVITGEAVTIKDKSLILPVYSFYFPLSMAIMAVGASSYYKASWAFYVAPGNVRGQIKLGTGWAIITRLFIPGFLIWAAIALSISKMALWSNFILAFCNMLLLGFSHLLFSLRELPLSLPQDEQPRKGGKNMARVLTTVFLGFGLGAVHILLLSKLYWWVHLLIATLDIIAVWLIADKIARDDR